ncbi:uncharacterized protein LOC128310901 isoform X2 [Anopheles moucheti]|uniref:uncharacterized protein LOC128310901 isoform X2 n=1 Tax=Anopheles moucheti TaxID=186751 RepID=UPI0022F06EC4|nr:uncharacterized protein LOC128310901 isoform X2 [Anopheles moucheti]
MLKENRPIEPLTAVDAADEEQDSAGSMSESEVMKLDTSIPAPSDVPPSLIISRRTYKTPDQLDNPTPAGEDEKEPVKQDISTTGELEVKQLIQDPLKLANVDKESKADDVLNPSDMKTEVVERRDTDAVQKDEPMAETGSDTGSKDTAETVKMEVDDEVPELIVEPKQKQTDSVADVPLAKGEQNESGKVLEDNDKEEEPVTGSKQSEVAVPEAEKTPVAILTHTKESRSENDEPMEAEEKLADKTGTTLKEEAVSESIEDPPLVVKGEGSGADCNSGIEPMFSEIIEEPVMFIFGVGAGRENDMGNTKKIETTTTVVSESNATTNPKEEDANACSTIGSSKTGNGETELPQNREGNGDDEELDLSRKVVPTKEKEMTMVEQDHGPKGEQGSSESDKKANSRGGKRIEKSTVPGADEPVVVSDKPAEKRRGSRKSNTPKKAFDLSVAATTLQMMETDEEISKDASFKVENEREKPLENAKVRGNPDKNGDHTVPSAADAVPKEELKNKSEPLESKEADREESPHSKQGLKCVVTKDLVKCEPVKKEDQKEPDDADEKSHTKIEQSKSEDDRVANEKPTVKNESEDHQPEELEGDSPPKRKRRHRNGLVDGLDISMVLDAGSDGGNNPPVRQSRRIAMQKIKEETNRREIEDQMLKKMKADAVKKKKDLGMKISDDDYRAERTSPEHSSDSSSDGGVGADGRRRKKKKKKKKGSLHQQAQQLQNLAKKQSTWNSASPSESSSETEAEDYFAEPYHSEEDVRRSNVLKSDHEFSPESDLETEAPAQPLKRARTARKARRTRGEQEEEEEEEEEEDDGSEDHACQECKKTDQPEWILLCDSCDKGYHCACLKPVLFTIPEGDWFCPVCLHRQLIERLQSKLELYDALRTKLEAEAKRREEEEQTAREAELAEQALANEREEQLRAQRRARQQQRLLDRADAEGRRSRSGSEEESSRDRRRRRHRNRRAPRKRSQSRSGNSSSDGLDGSGSSDRSGSGSESKSSTDSDDIPIYKLRRRASARVSYKFNEYDNLIDSAIRREMRGSEMMEEEEEDDEDDGHGYSKGKDISTIIEATTREEQARKKALQQDNEGDGGEEDGRLNGDREQQHESEAIARGTNSGEEEEGEGAVVRQERKPAPATNNRSVSAVSKKPKKKKKKLCKIELSSEEDDEDDSDEDFRGEASGSEDDEEEDEDEDEEDDNSMSGDSESSLETGRGRNNRMRKPSSRAAASKRRRIVENSDDSDELEEEMRRAKAKKSRKNRVLDDSDEELDLDDDDDEDSEDYDSDDLCSDTETESSRSSKSSGSSSSSAPSTEGDWRRKKKSKGAKSKPKVSAGGGKHLDRPKKTEARPKPSIESSDESESDRDEGGKGGKTMPGRKKQSKKTSSRSSPDSGRAGEKKTDRKTRGKKIHYIVDEDFESSDDGIRPGVQRPDTPPEEREKFIRRQEEIKRMLAENNAAKAKELATSKIDQLVGRSGSKEASKDSLSDVPMQVIESARILDIDFLKSTSGNTARISTVDSVVDFDDELPEDFDPDDEMDDEALAKIMEEEDFAHHQLKPTAGATTSPAELLPPVPPPPSKGRHKSLDPEEFLLQQQQKGGRPIEPPTVARKDQLPPPLPLPVNLASSSATPPHPYPALQSPIKALLKPTGIPTSTIMSPIVSGAGGGSTILANALQTGPTLPPPPLLKESHPTGRPEVLMRGGPPHSLPPGGHHQLPVGPHHKPELSHLMMGLGGSVPLSLAKGIPLPPHHSGHRLPPGGLSMPPNMLGHVPHPSHGLRTKPVPGSGVVSNNAGIAAAVVSAASIGAGVAGPPGMAHTPPPASPTTAGPIPRMPIGATPSPTTPSSERRPGRRKKITPLREDLKRKGAAPPDQPSVPTAAHQEQHQRPPPQHPSLHHGHVAARLPPPPTMPSSSTAGPPIGMRPSLPPVTTSHNSFQQSASAIAAAAAAAAAAQELAIKVHSRTTADAGGGSAGAGMHVNEPPLSVPSSVAHLSYLSENPLFAHRLGPLPSSILSSGSSSLQRIAAISGAAPPTVFGDPAAYNGGWKPPPSASSKPKTTAGPTPASGMMVGPPPVGSLEHYHEYNPGNHHYNPYYNVLDRAGHLRPPPTIGELHRTSALSPTTFTTLQPLEFPHVLKPASENPHHQPHHPHHHHSSATPSPAASSAGGDDGPSVERSHGAGPPPPAHAASSSSSVPVENHPSSASSPASPTGDSTGASGAGTVAPSLVPPTGNTSTPASSSSTSTSVFGELVSYFSSQQDDLDS